MGVRTGQRVLATIDGQAHNGVAAGRIIRHGQTYIKVKDPYSGFVHSVPAAFVQRAPRVAGR
jgi:hypothetical protein